MNQVQQTNKNQVSVMTTFLTSEAVKNKVNAIVGSKGGEKLISNLVSSVQQNPALAECERGSVVNCALAGYSLNLDFATNQAYFVPFKNSKKGITEAQFMISAKGYKQLAIRSNQYKNINVLSLKEGELKKFDRLTEEYEIEYIEDDAIREATPTTHYIAYFELNSGFRKVIIWTKQKMEVHAKTYSQAYKTDLQYNKQYSFWSKNFDEMAEKTMIRQLISKWGIMSTEIQNAYNKDMAVLDEKGNPEYVDNEQVEVVEEIVYINQEQIEILCKTLVNKNINVVDYIKSKGYEDVNAIPLEDYKKMIGELSNE